MSYLLIAKGTNDDYIAEYETVEEAQKEWKQLAFELLKNVCPDVTKYDTLDEYIHSEEYDEWEEESSDSPVSWEIDVDNFYIYYADCFNDFTQYYYIEKKPETVIDGILLQLDLAEKGLEEYSYELMDSSVCSDHIYEAYNLVIKLKEELNGRE